MTKFIVHWTTSEYVYPYEWRQKPGRTRTTGEIPVFGPSEEAVRQRMLRILKETSDKNTRFVRVDWIKEAA